MHSINRIYCLVLLFPEPSQRRDSNQSRCHSSS